MNIFWIIIAVILVIISNTSLKYYSINKDNRLYFLSTLLYIILVYCYAKVYEGEDVSTGFILINISILFKSSFMIKLNITLSYLLGYADRMIGNNYYQKWYK